MWSIGRVAQSARWRPWSGKTQSRRYPNHLALPRSQYGHAIGYVLNHWDELRRFTEDGRLETDSSAPERTLRLRAISRKTGYSSGVTMQVKPR